MGFPLRACAALLALIVLVATGRSIAEPPAPAELSGAGKAALAAHRSAVQREIEAATQQPPQTRGEELKARTRIDQFMRSAVDEIRSCARLPDQSCANLPETEIKRIERMIWADISARDERNNDWLKSAYPDGAWPRISRDGEEAATSAWLIAQHSLDVAWQEEVLARMEPLLASGDASRRNYAFMLDRVLIRKGRPQRFGTQGACMDGKIAISPIEDATNVASRRAEMELQPMEEYEQLLGVGRAC
jgi:hypothetical protein